MKFTPELSLEWPGRVRWPLWAILLVTHFLTSEQRESIRLKKISEKIEKCSSVSLLMGYLRKIIQYIWYYWFWKESYLIIVFLFIFCLHMWVKMFLWYLNFVVSEYLVMIVVFEFCSICILGNDNNYKKSIYLFRLCYVY